MRIALIAMSGVRAYNPELTALGLSLPGFVERGKTIASLPSLGLLTLAALTDDRHDVDYYEVDDVAEMDPLPGCDLAAFSTFSAQAKECYALSDRFRAAGVTTVIGGLHATAVPDEALEHVDIVVAGEANPSGGGCSPMSKQGGPSGSIDRKCRSTWRTLRFPDTTCSTPTVTTGSRSRRNAAAPGAASSAPRRSFSAPDTRRSPWRRSRLRSTR
jgi:hypothetical protein